MNIIAHFIRKILTQEEFNEIRGGIFLSKVLNKVVSNKEEKTYLSLH